MNGDKPEDKNRNPQKKYVIRPVTPQDIPLVNALDEVVFPSSPWGLTSFYKNLDQAYDLFFGAFSEETEQEINANTHLQKQASILGFGMIRVLAGEAEVLLLAVTEAARGEGIGYTLLLHLLDKARREGAESVYLEVRASNAAALALYRKAGFAACGQRTGYYASPKEDAILMHLCLHEAL